jgi:ATP-binding cassette subfamily F protein uup
MGGPNVLVLDEPTNDFDVETLTALEDLLDSFGGTLIVISHDRYFLERVCDDTYALLGDGGLAHLVGGVDEFIQRRRAARGQAESSQPKKGQSNAAERRLLEKDLARIERSLARLDTDEATIHGQMAEMSTSHDLLEELNRKLQQMSAKRDGLEAEWILAAEALN